jgi:hypothetical protein
MWASSTIPGKRKTRLLYESALTIFIVFDIGIEIGLIGFGIRFIGLG